MKLLNEAQAAEYLAVSPRTLQAWRFYGRGPRWIKLSARCVRYAKDDLDAWITEHLTGGELGSKSAAAGNPA